MSRKSLKKYKTNRERCILLWNFEAFG